LPKIDSKIKDKLLVKEQREENSRGLLEERKKSNISTELMNGFNLKIRLYHKYSHFIKSKGLSSKQLSTSSKIQHVLNNIEHASKKKTPILFEY
jgi:hypothetical protein